MKIESVLINSGRGAAVLLASTLLHVLPVRAEVQVVQRPPTTARNAYYPGNRAPLAPDHFVRLPAGAVQPRGWLREVLRRQRDGLCGHLGEISAWLEKDGNAWLSQDGEGKYGWEEVPYWLRGYIDLAYILDDRAMIDESRVWIEGVLASQRPDGDFGPARRFKDGARDYWANMIMLFCLESYYDHSHDPRVPALMSRYFKHHLAVPDEALLTHYWQRMRGGDELYSIYWLYNRTGDAELLKVAEKIHRRTANWKLPHDLPDWHNVNIAEAFREPAQFAVQSHDPGDRQAAYDNFAEVRRRYGQVPGGMFGGDEKCRPGHDDPHQAIETCGMVEQMLSDEILVGLTGDPFWADNCEDVAFNSLPAALTPDLRALRYLTAPNMISSDGQNHAPGINNRGPFFLMNPFSSRCCQHNHSQGWPYFADNLWLATPDNGVCAVLYAASEVALQVGEGGMARFVEETHYPFEEAVRFTFHADRPQSFPLYLRIPGWCRGASVTINGESAGVRPEGGTYLRIARAWHPGDRVDLQLPMQVTVKRWTANHDSVSVNYGPLTFSLKIEEQYRRIDPRAAAISDSHWQPGADATQWPSFEIQPASAWNYGLMVGEGEGLPPIQVVRRAWPGDDFPFAAHASPIVLQARGRRVPTWKVDAYGLCGPLPQSPANSAEPEETMALIPMGAARLRISAFPVVASGAHGHPAESRSAGSP